MSSGDEYSDFYSTSSGQHYKYSSSQLPGNLNFSLDEIREQLNQMGYHDIPDDSLMSIKDDLNEIIAKDSNINQNTDNSWKSRSNNPPKDWFVSGDNRDTDASSIASVTSLTQNAPNRMKRVVYQPDDSTPRYGQDTYSEFSTTPRSAMGDANHKKQVNFPHEPVDDVFNYTGEWNGDSRPSTSGGLIKTGLPYTKGYSSGSWKKHDPVSRYHSYKAEWQRHRPPGESPHKQLRWAVKAAMMVREEPVKMSSMVHSQPNSARRYQARYDAPGDNKRNDLRWQIRQEMANPEVYFD